MATRCWLFVYLSAGVVQLCMMTAWGHKHGPLTLTEPSTLLNKDGYKTGTDNVEAITNTESSRHWGRVSAIVPETRGSGPKHITPILNKHRIGEDMLERNGVFSGHEGHKREESHGAWSQNFLSRDLWNKAVHHHWKMSSKPQSSKLNYGVSFPNKSSKDVPISLAKTHRHWENKSSNQNSKRDFRSRLISAPTTHRSSPGRKNGKPAVNADVPRSMLPTRHDKPTSQIGNQNNNRLFQGIVTQVFAQTPDESHKSRRNTLLRNIPRGGEKTSTGKYELHQRKQDDTSLDPEGSTLSNDKLSIEYLMRRHRRGVTYTKPQDPNPTDTKAKPIPSQQQADTKRGNISESSLSYRAKGQMGYVDSSKTRSIGNGEIRDLEADVEADSEETPRTIVDITPSAESSTTSAVVTSTRGDEHVLLLGLMHEDVEDDVTVTNSSSEPESESEGEPESESEAEPEAEAEQANGTDIPHGYNEFDDCDKAICYAEPYPEWRKAKLEYGGAWEFHVYSIGISFAVLAIYSFTCMILLRQKANLLSRGYFMSLNSMLLLMGTTRAVYLLVDGYDSLKLFHPIISYMLINFSFPCLTSAFSILFLAMLRATKMQIISKRIQKNKFLAGIIVFHFVLSFTVDIIVGLVYNLRVLFLVCQITFILWGAFLFCGYFYLFWKLYNSPSMEYGINRESGYHQTTNYSLGGVVPSGRDSSREHKSKLYKLKSFHLKVMLNLALKVTFSTAFLGIAYIAVVIYGMVDVFNVFAKTSPEPWPFWAYHFCIRLIELAMCATMSFVATQPLRYNGGAKSSKGEASKSDCTDFLYFIPCYRMCIEHDSDKDVSTSTDRCIAIDGTLNRTDSEISKGVLPAWHEVAHESHQMVPMVNGDEGRYDDDTKRPRPSSMLYYDSGLVRFRQEGDSEGDPIASTDEELDSGELGPPEYYRATAPDDHLGDGSSKALRDKYYLAHYVARNAHWRFGSRRSAANHGQSTGYNTPGTPLSLCSTDLDIMSGDFSFRTPSSIHLRDSIDRALNYSDLQLRTPDLLDTVESVSLPGSPDALRASMYSYATAYQDSKSVGTMSLSPGRKLYSALSHRASTPSLNYKDPDMAGSGWFQKYFWEKFGNIYKSQPPSIENSIDGNLSENCSNKYYLPLSTYTSSPEKESENTNCDTDFV